MTQAKLLFLRKGFEYVSKCKPSPTILNSCLAIFLLGGPYSKYNLHLPKRMFFFQSLPKFS
jgi:hypothetical protein